MNQNNKTVPVMLGMLFYLILSVLGMFLFIRSQNNMMIPIIYFSGIMFFLNNILFLWAKSRIILVGYIPITLIWLMAFIYQVIFIVTSQDSRMIRSLQRAIRTLDERAPLAIFWWISVILGLVAIVLLIINVLRMWRNGEFKIIKPSLDSKNQSYVAGLNKGFKDPTFLSLWTTISLYIYIGSIVLFFMLVVLNVTTRESLQFSPDGLLYSFINNGYMVDYYLRKIRYIVIILALIWIYRANYNVRQLGANNMVFTPKWSVGWMFVPIASLWKPYQALQEIWKTSFNPQDWKPIPKSDLITKFWIVWITTGVLITLIEIFNLLYTVNVFEFSYDLIIYIFIWPQFLAKAISALIFIRIIKKINNMQLANFKNQSNY